MRMVERLSCRGIPASSNGHRSLIDSCLGDVTARVRDPALCAEATSPGLRDSCYLKLARLSADRALCDDIRAPGLKSACTGEPVIVP